MSWYKLSKNFSDRNIINQKIIYLKELSSELIDMSKIVFQSGKTAKDTSHRIITGVKLTSYPKIRDMLIEADSIALDSPWRFADICQQVVGEIDKKIYKLEKEREEFGSNKKNKIKKGWI